MVVVVVVRPDRLNGDDVARGREHFRGASVEFIQMFGWGTQNRIDRQVNPMNPGITNDDKVSL